MPFAFSLCGATPEYPDFHFSAADSASEYRWEEFLVAVAAPLRLSNVAEGESKRMPEKIPSAQNPKPPKPPKPKPKPQIPAHHPIRRPQISAGMWISKLI